MVEVYMYLPAKEVENVVECGLKLSKWYDKEVNVIGVDRKCISALLSPKDNLQMYKDLDYRCVKLKVPPNQCYIADKSLYSIAIDSPRVMKLYTSSIIPIDEYIFGTYRLPECLVISTLIAGQISLLGKDMDSPVLFNNSEELYLSNFIEHFREQHEDFNDTLLYCFFSKLAQMQKVDKIEDKNKKNTVFIDERTGKTIVTGVPDMDKY